MQESRSGIFPRRCVEMSDRTYNKHFSQNLRLNRKLSIETLLEEFKSRALEIMNLNIDKSTIIALFGLS